MNRSLRDLIKDIWEKFGYKAVFLILLMITNSLIEGVGLMLLLPLLNIVGVGGQQQENLITDVFQKIHAVFEFLPKLELILLLIVAIFLVQGAVFLTQSWLAARLQHDYVAIWRENLFSNYMTASWSFFLKNKSGDLVNTIIGETNRLGGAFYLVSQLASVVIVAIVYIGFAFYISWQTTLALLILAFFLFILIYRVSRKDYQIGYQISTSQSDLEAVVHEFIGGAKLVKATATEKPAISSVATVVSKLRMLYFWSSFRPNMMRVIVQLFGISFLCLLLYVGMRHLNLDPAVILVVLFVFLRLFPRLSTMQNNLQLLNVYLPAIRTTSESVQLAEKYGEILEYDTHTKRLFKESVSVSFANVTFAYNENPVLHDISLDFPAGKTIGIVGSSGSGKSTLVDCMLKLFEPESGSIVIQSTPIQELPLCSWRKCVGYVSQDTFLFHDTIRNNILWGAENCDEDDLTEATRKAFVHDFIMSLPEGYDTIVGDRGVRLSGGQRQRIGLARALINRPALLILDEATSALDSESEEHVLKAIADLHGQMTIIAIAHRLSTVRNSDYIYILEGGRVVEHGTQKQLLAQKGRFHRLWELQKIDQ